jgi:hypothetical protein
MRTRFKPALGIALWRGPARGQTPRLFMADSIERHIDLPLKAQLAVPVGFAMADKNEFGHGRDAARRCRLRRSQTFSISTATKTTAEAPRQSNNSARLSGSVLKIGFSTGT